MKEAFPPTENGAKPSTMRTKAPVVLVGVGELGGIFSLGLLKAGHPVVPITRAESPEKVAREWTEPALVLVTVPESELHPVLANLPERWKTRVGLLQNELLPRDFRLHELSQVTVAVVWFEKKPLRVVRVLQPSVLYGPGSPVLSAALRELGIPHRFVDSEAELLHELVLKNLYILTTNLAGLRTGGSVGELWRQHRRFAETVAEEVLTLQAALSGATLDRQALFQGLEQAIAADPDHLCTGRSAVQRLDRALAHAAALGLTLPNLFALKQEVKSQ